MNTIETRLEEMLERAKEFARFNPITANSTAVADVPHILPFIKKLIASQGWIPLHGPGSRKPTAEDADDNRLVLFRHDGGRPWIGTFSPYGGDPTHWHAIRKFTPASDPDTEAFEKWYFDVYMNQYGGLPPAKDLCRSIFNSALAHRDAQAEAASRDMAQKLEKAEAACREVVNFDWGNCEDSIDRIIGLCRDAAPKP